MSQLLAISKKSFVRLQNDYNDVLLELNQALAIENAYSNTTGVKKSTSEIKDLKNEFISWLKQMPCYGFNSSRYDLNVLEKHLIPNLLQSNEKLLPIKRGNSFLALRTPELLFLDVKNYLAPNYSLSLFLSHYGASETKGSFPYKLVKGVADLDKTGLPSLQDFYSTLRGCTISLEEYRVVELAWREHHMLTLFDLLRWYSLLDV